MGGKNGSGAGMGAGGAGKGGGKGGTPMSADQADAANATRRQNIFTTVGGLSRPGGSPGGPASPGARPSGPSGPPKGGAAGPPLPRPRPGTPSEVPAYDTSPYPTNVSGPATLDGMAASPLSRLFQSPMGPALQGQAPDGLTPEETRSWAKTQSRRPLIPSSGSLPIAPGVRT